MSYLVLARKYRSKTFDELVGQEPIARTLANAITADRTAHAYLFCGTRGVGKTSLARIFAKALNVDESLAESDAIAAAILRGDDLDVIEIDGASNRGIQEARDLIAGAGLLPTRCPYKIYIIDEVHMLTREAFNALLKTMEEPPSHVKFILCTTDPQKVPATIQSRCQRFDFRAIPTSLIARQLRAIVAEEGIEAEDAVLLQIAQMGQGSMRDALSLLDRLISGGGKTLTLAAAEEMLGLPDRTVVEQVVDAVARSDAPAALEAGAELIARGATVDQALEMITEHLRNVMVLSACGRDTEILALPPDALETAAAHAERFDLPALVYMIALCDAASRNARGSSTARALFDATLVRLSVSEHLADAREAAARSATPVGAAGARAAGAKKKTGTGDRPRAPRTTTGSIAGAGAVVEVKSRPPVAEIDAAAPRAAVEREAPRAAVGRDEPGADDDLWPRVLAAASGAPGDQSKVEHLVFRSFDGRTLRLGVDATAHASARFLQMQSDAIAELVRRATERRVKVVIEKPEPEPGLDVEPDGPDLADARRRPIVKKAVDIFDAVVVDVTESPAPPRAASPSPEGPSDVR